ncbi:Hypothetical predicted protein, partial [Pelobates cultripes]
MEGRHVCSERCKDHEWSKSGVVRSLKYTCDRATDKWENWARSRSPPGPLALQLSALAGESLVPTSLDFKVPQTISGEEGAIYSPEEAETEMEGDVPKVPTQPHILKSIVTTKMAVTTDVNTTTTKMATTTSNMASTNIEKKYFYYSSNPNMPPEMSSVLPASADMLIDLIKNKRLEIRNDFKKDFEAIYGH